jgi:membrane-bound lytic murein transglycosylase MltF
MGMKKLVLYLELGFLCFGLVVLLLSSIDRKETTQQPVAEQQKIVVAEVLPGDVEPQAPEDGEVIEQPAEKAAPEIVTLLPAGRKVRPGGEEDKDIAIPLPDDQAADVQTAKLWERQQWTGDLDGMRKRRIIRALVPFSRTFFFLDRGRKRGLIHDVLMEYEKFLNKKVVKSNKHLTVHIVVIPTPRDHLFSDLAAGYGDISAGNLTITPEREKLVDFADPTLTNVQEIIVTGPAAPTLKTIFDLAGQEISVRKSSSYYESLLTLNNTLQSIGRKPLTINTVDEYLEDEDLLEMVNAGLMPMIIIDNHKGEFWAKIFKNIKLHHNLRLRTGGEIAWAIRKNSPLLKKDINKFVKTIKKGTLTGNILYQRYLQDTKYIRNSLSEAAMKRYNHTIDLFKKYAGKYDFPYLMLTALAYQESGLDQKKRSHAGAIGIMQVLPTTAADRNVGIKNISKLENNIHAGTRYLRFMADRYFADPDLTKLNRDLFTIASYNAGPARVAKLRKEAARRGLDPNIWFNNVEVVAAARIGRETVQYVRNIYKYYVAYEYIIKKEKLKKVGTSILKSHYEKSNF